MNLATETWRPYIFWRIENEISGDVHSWIKAHIVFEPQGFLLISATATKAKDDISFSNTASPQHPFTSTPIAPSRLNSGLSAVKTNKESSFSPAGTDGSNPTVHETFDSPVNALSGGIRRIIIEANAVKLPPLDLSPIIDNVAKESPVSIKDELPPSPRNGTPRTPGSRSFSPRGRLVFSPESSPRSLRLPGSDGDGSLLQVRFSFSPQVGSTRCKTVIKLRLAQQTSPSFAANTLAV
ncbi:hypothetical protein ANCCAN_20938 [Ancylostoma caninum]|uniref:Uncharacterized protein n=1 Tax=Ancylostoma caninum TaxID=29170 RepID=A0A368FQZ7_ANCCA|nr:hypothetical protein ANCCAN_20938 [Ancylostoma caninum]